MKFLGNLFNFYLDASIHVALALISFLWATGQILNISLDRHLILFVFFCSIFCYNFIKYGLELEKYGMFAKGYHGTIRFFGVLCLGIALYQSFFLDGKALLLLTLLAFLTGIYALPVLPGTRNFRSYGIFKVVLVALVWSGTTVFLPAVSSQVPINWDIWIEGLQRFLVVFALILPFEVRDMAYDAPELLTLPRLYGLLNTKILGVLFGVGFFLLTFLKDKIGAHEVALKGLLLLMLMVVVLLTTKNQGKYFASFWVEAVPIIWCFFIWRLGW